MLVHAVETYFRRNKEKLKDKLTSSHSKFGNKIKQKQILRPFIFPAILLDVDGMLLAINCQQYPPPLTPEFKWNELPAILLAILPSVDAP